jgi:hypothetical protein
MEDNMTISFEEKVYGITGEELEKIFAAEYTTVEPEIDEVPSFLDSITDLEAELVQGFDLHHDRSEATILSFSPVIYEAHNFGGDAA